MQWQSCLERLFATWVPSSFRDVQMKTRAATGKRVARTAFYRRPAVDTGKGVSVLANFLQNKPACVRRQMI